MEDITAVYKYQVEKIVGAASSGVGCGVFNKNVVLPDGSDGLAVGCVRVAGEGDLDVITQDVFNFEVTILETLGGEGILEPLKGIYPKVEAYIGERKLDVSFVLGFFYKGICYLLRSGDEVLVEVFEPPQSSQLDIKAGSGKLSDGQVYMIATKTCVDLFDFGVLKEGEAELPEVIDGMATEISAREDSAEIAAVFIKVTKEGNSSGTEGTEGKEGVEGVITESTEEVVEETIEEGMTEGIEGNEDTEESQEVAGGSEKERSDDVVEVTYENREEMAVLAAEEPQMAMEEQSPSPKSGFGQKLKGVGTAALGILARVAKEIKGVFKGDRRAIGSFRKKLVLVVVVVVIVLAVSVGLAIKKRNDGVQLAEFKTHYEAASSKYNEGASLLELNKFRAREILVDAQGEVTKALAINSSDADAQKLSGDIENKLKETDVANATTFDKVADVAESIKSLSISGKSLVAVGGKKAYQVNTGGGVTDSISDLQSTAAGIVFDSKLYWVDAAGVWREELGGGTKSTVASKTSALDIGVFFGNVYLLKSDQVAKIVPVENGYADPTDYLKNGQGFKTSSRMAIDTNIWVTDGDKILKFNRGSSEPFEISGLSGKIGELSAIYTDGTLANLYVVDKTNSALLVIDKEGNYKKSLQAKELVDATDLVVNDAEDTVYVAVGSKVVSASLK